jgi:hypothetical protein
MRLSRRSEPFDSDEFIDELKMDGFRALTHIQDGQGELVTRNGNVFREFAELATWIAEHLRVESAVLDGEISCLDETGRPTFRDLIFRKRQCVFIERIGSSKGLREKRPRAAAPYDPVMSTFSLPGLGRAGYAVFVKQTSVTCKMVGLL